MKWLIFSVIALPFILIGFSVSDSPRVTGNLAPSHYDLARVDKLFKQHNPRRLKQGQTVLLELSTQDIDSILVTGLSSLGNTTVKTHLVDNKIEMDITIHLPKNKYANFSLSLVNSHKKLLAIEQLGFGSLSIPGWVLDPIWNITQKYLWRYAEYQGLINAIQNIEISSDQLAITYTADREAVKKIRQRGLNFLVDDAERQRIRIYQQYFIQSINGLVDKVDARMQSGEPVSISRILQAMFEFAINRSSVDGASGIEENRALLFVLSMYVGGKNIDAVLGKPGSAQTQFFEHRPGMTLLNRIDLAQHFGISAFLAAAAGSGLAQATGLYKEVSDSKGGSGFSFADLAADRAGVEFGTMAVASEASAYSLQEHMAQVIDENDYMPTISNLPEGLQETTFKRQYGSTEDMRYQKMQNELDKRIKLCPLYRAKGK